MMGGNSHLGGDLLSSGGYGHQRSRSIGHSPLVGTHALEAEMAADAARLGLLPTGLGAGGFASRGGGAMGSGLDERSAAYARAGASPRLDRWMRRTTLVTAVELAAMAMFWDLVLATKVVTIWV
jgi:hypothetical protein